MGLSMALAAADASRGDDGGAAPRSKSVATRLEALRGSVARAWKEAIEKSEPYVGGRSRDQARLVGQRLAQRRLAQWRLAQRRLAQWRLAQRRLGQRLAQRRLGQRLAQRRLGQRRLGQRRDRRRHPGRLFGSGWGNGFRNW